MDHLTELGVYHWLILGVVLLTLEVLGTAGFLLGAAVAALVTAGLVWFDVLQQWQSQLSIFALLAVVLSVAYWYLFRRVNQQTDSPMLNQAAQRMVGQKTVLQQPLEHGRGKVQFGDALWTVEAEAPLAEGTEVIVVSVEDMTLTVKPTQP